MSVTGTNSAIAATIVTMLVVGSSVYHFTITMERKYDICKRSECLASADRVLKTMDKTADPCNDFYQYACGGWIKDNPVPEGMGIYNQFLQLDDKNQQILRDVLNSSHFNDRDAIKKVKIYYKACINEDALDKADASPIFDLMMELGGFPLFDNTVDNDAASDRNIDQEGMARNNTDSKDSSLEKCLGRSKIRFVDFWSVISSPIINMGINPDEKNSSQNIIRLAQPRLIMPDREYYLSSKFQAARTSYKTFLKDFLALVWKNLDKKRGTLNFDENALQRATDEIFELEKGLAKILQPLDERVDVLDIYRKMTLAEMHVKVSSEFNWTAYVQEVMKKANILVKSDNEAVVLGSPYFSKMMSVLDKFKMDTIQKYIIVYNLANNINLLSKKYRDTEAPFRKEIKGTSEELPRWKMCLLDANNIFPMPLGAIFVENMFSEESKSQILRIKEEILKSYNEKLNEMEWLDERTKLGVKAKLDNIVTLFGFPDYIIDKDDPKLDDEYKDVELFIDKFFEGQFDLYFNQLLWSLRKLEKPVDREEWVLGPAEANAYYNENQNSMVFTAGVLQSPFYSPHRPVAMNYGGIGMAVAWLLSSAIVDAGDFDANGELADWWSKESRDHHQGLLQCFVKQYNQFFYEPAGMFLNGNTTVKRNVEDNEGVRHAFYGYQKWASENPGKELSVSSLNSFTPEQLFFIATAQLWCEVERPESAKATISQGGGTPGIFRVNGPARNFEEFGKAFNCEREKDVLYPSNENMCVIA